MRSLLRHPWCLAFALLFAWALGVPPAQSASMIPPLDIRPKDFAFIKKDGVYHLFYIRHNDFLPPFATEVDFGHAISKDLYNWTQLPPVLPIDPGGWDNLHVWAPHIVESGGLYWMFYTGLSDAPGQFADTQRMGVAVSSDLMSWNRVSQSPVWQASGAPWAWWQPLRPAMACRDPFVMPDPSSPGQWLMYYTATPANDTVATLVGVARSPNGDLREWVDEKPLWITHRSFTFNPSTESPHLFRHGARWFMFITTGAGQALTFYTTNNPVGEPAEWTYRGRLRTMIGGDTQLWIASETLVDGENDLFAFVNFNRIDIKRIVWGTGDNFTLAEPSPFHMVSMDFARLSVREGDPIGFTLISANGFAFSRQLEAFVRLPDGSEVQVPADSVGLNPRPVMSRDTTRYAWYPRRWPANGDTTTAMRLRVAMDDGTASTGWLMVIPNPRRRMPTSGGGGTIEDPPSNEFPPPVFEDTLAFRPRVTAPVPEGAARTGLRPLRGSPIGGPHTLAFDLGSPGPVRLELFDLLGRRIATLADGTLPAGAHVRSWDGRDTGGTRVARGLVFARLTSSAGVQTTRLVVER